MDRYLVERALIVRPDSMSSTRAAMRRLGIWLAKQRPAVENLAELTRADLLDFMTWLVGQRKVKHPEQRSATSTAAALSPKSPCSSATEPMPNGPTCPLARY